jgi:transposase InsO family protein
MWGVMWGAPTILKVAVPGFPGRCVTLVCVSARPARCSPNIPTLAEVQPSVRRSLDRLLEGQVIDDANLSPRNWKREEDYYNYHRPHGALGRQTPYERLRQKAQDPLP